MSVADTNIQESGDAVKRTDKERMESRRLAWRKYCTTNREKLAARSRAYYEANREKALARSEGYRAANRERINAANRARNQKNREKRSAYNKSYRAKNLDKLKAAQKTHHAKNPAKRNAYNKAYHVANREKLSAYAKAHPEIGRARTAKRRAIEFGATVGDVAAIKEWDANWRRRKRVTCHWCRQPFPPKRCHADHVIPLSKGGAHSLENLVVSCACCNRSKSDKLPDVWNQQITQPMLL